MSWVSGPPTEGKVFSASSDRVRVQSYDRKIFEGLDYIKLATDCNIAKRKHHMRIFFHEKFPDRDDFNVSYEELTDGISDSANEFLEYKKAWFRKKFKGEVPHVLVFPDEYMTRVNKYDRRNYKPKSLAAEVEKQLESKGADKNQGGRWWHKLFGL